MFKPIIKEKTLSSKIRKYISDLTGEYKNKPVYNIDNKQWILPQNNNIIMKFLNQYRDEFNEENIGYGVYNLVEIIKTARGELSGCDLSRLDLRKVNINGVICSRSCKFDKKYLAADFSYSKIGVSNLFNMTIPPDIKQISYSSIGNKILLSNNMESVELDKNGVIVNRYDFGCSVYDDQDNIIFVRDNRLFLLNKNDNRFFDENGNYYTDKEIESGKYILSIKNIGINKIEYKNKKIILHYDDKRSEIDIINKIEKEIDLKIKESVFNKYMDLMIFDDIELDFDDINKSFILKKGSKITKKTINFKNIDKNSLKCADRIETYNDDKSRLFINFNNIIGLEIDINNIDITNIYQSENYNPYVRTEYDRKNKLLYFTIDDITKIIYVKRNRIEYLIDKIEDTPHKSKTIGFLYNLSNKVPLEFILEIIPNTEYREQIEKDVALYKIFKNSMLSEKLIIKGCNFEGVELENEDYQNILEEHYDVIENIKISNSKPISAIKKTAGIFQYSELFANNNSENIFSNFVLAKIAENIGTWIKKRSSSYDYLGDNPFLWACKNGNIYLIKTLIKLDINLKDTVNNDGDNGFLVACINGKTETAEWLNANLDFNGKKYKDTVNNYGYNGFLLACYNGKTETANWLNANLDFNGKKYKDTVDNDDYNGFLMACYNGKTETANWLNANLDFNGKKYKDIVDKYGNNGFLVACIKGKTETANWLNANLDFNGKNYKDTVNNDGNNGFLVACGNGNTETANWLNVNLDFNGKKYKDTENNDGNNGYLIAIENGKTETAEWLNDNLDFNGKNYKDTKDKIDTLIEHLNDLRR